MRLLTFLLIVTAFWLCTSRAFAGPGLEQGITAFSAGQYPQALSLFQQDIQQNPQNPLTHYYMGLSYHCMNRIPEATVEYKWVLLNSQDPELIQRVQLGLQVLAKAQPPAAPVAQPTATHNPPPKPQKRPPQEDTAAAGQMGKIVDIYTDWCGYCKRFAPIFHNASKKYKGVLAFQSVNAEEGNNRELVRQFKIRGYPTILFFDQSGKLVNRIDGAPASMQDFETMIAQTYSGLKPF